MKRPVVASLSVLLALAGRGFPQTPSQLPDPVGEPVPVTPATPEPGRAMISVPNLPAKTAVAKPEAKAQTPSSASHPPTTAEAIAAPGGTASPAQAAANGQPQSRMPNLAVTHMGPPEQIWLRGGYLNWWVKDAQLPAILAVQQTVDATGTPVGNPTETIGGGVVDYGAAGGFRVFGGMWLDCQHIVGIEAGFFLLNEQSRDFSLSSNGNPAILRPFSDALTNTPQNFFVSSPNVAIPGGPALQGFSGDLAASTSLRLGGAEVNFVRNVANDGCTSVNVLMGFRHINLEETLDVTSVSRSTVPALVFNGVNQASQVTVNDHFRTRNQLWAGQLGLRAETRRDMWFAALSAKVALGPNTQTSEVEGSTTAVVNGATQTANGGFLAVPGQDQFGNRTNAGRDNTRWFTVAPEVGLTVGAQLTSSIRAYLTYDFLYINNVVRPGDLYSTAINTRFVPSSAFYNTSSGPFQPAFRTSRDDFYAHGIEAGLQFSY